MIIEGLLLTGREFEPIEGRVIVEENTIIAIEEASVASTDIVLPAFVNSHTHIGDSIAKEAGEGLSLEELVSPPDGLKHRLLRAADPESLIDGMRRSIQFMEHGGTGTFIDFREGGEEGVSWLQRASQGCSAIPIILGRDSGGAVRASDGLGASSVRDASYAEELQVVRADGKLFGIHAGERDSGDIDGAFDLDPDFLVHMVHPTPTQLDRLENTGVPVVVCPRSNLVTDAGLPPIEELQARTTVALGTDNVMLNAPSMFREMEFVSKLTDVTAKDVLWMATGAGAEIVGLPAGVLAPDHEAKLLVLDGDSNNLGGAHDPVRAVVRRAGEDDVKRVIL